MHFKMLSAICFDLDQCEILSSGNGLRLNKRESFLHGFKSSPQLLCINYPLVVKFHVSEK